MNPHQPLTSHHLNLCAKFAYLLDLQPRVEDQPRDSVLGSILGRRVCQSPSTTTFTDAECDGLIWNPSFTPPRFSTAYLERVHTILLERDIKVQRLQQSLTTIAEAFLAKQDQEVQRNPSRHVTKQLPYDRRFIGHYPIIGLYQVVPLCRVTPVLVSDTPQNAWGRCPHDCLCKPGETHSLICQACHLGLPPWMETRKTLAFTDRPLNNVDDADIIEGLEDEAPIEDHKTKQRTCITAPNKKQVAEWNKLFSEAHLPAESHDYNITVSLTGDGDVPLDKRSYHNRHATQMFEAAQSWKQVGVVVGPTCLRCGASLAKRKGTKYCSDNCRKRHHEENDSTQGEG